MFIDVLSGSPWVTFQRCKTSQAVFNRWWEESDMDAEDLAKAALSAIDDWLDEEIVGFEPVEGWERIITFVNLSENRHGKIASHQADDLSPASQTFELLGRMPTTHLWQLLMFQN